MAARAVLAAREARADRADEPVVVQVQHDPRAGGARRGERAPAERRLHVVRVHDARAGAANGSGDVVGCEPAAQQPERGARAAQRRRVALQHLRFLAELRADQPREVLDRPLLPAGHAVAVVEQEDQATPACGRPPRRCCRRGRARRRRSRSGGRSRARPARRCRSRPPRAPRHGTRRRSPIVGFERDMDPGLRRAAGPDPEERLLAVPEASDAGRRLHQELQAERGERLLVERLAPLVVADADSDVVEHRSSCRALESTVLSSSPPWLPPPRSSSRPATGAPTSPWRSRPWPARRPRTARRSWSWRTTPPTRRPSGWRPDTARATSRSASRAG